MGSGVNVSVGVGVGGSGVEVGVEVPVGVGVPVGVVVSVGVEEGVSGLGGRRCGCGWLQGEFYFHLGITVLVVFHAKLQRDFGLVNLGKVPGEFPAVQFVCQEIISAPDGIFEPDFLDPLLRLGLESG